jgi:hypothetical protein
VLFIESRLLAYSVVEAIRLRLVDALRAEGFVPVIGSIRRRCFELLDVPRADGLAAKLESELTNAPLTEGRAAYLPGEIFCGGDHILFLIFNKLERQAVQAGIVFNIETVNPLQRLDLFCQLVRDLLLKLINESGPMASESLPAWQPVSRSTSQGLARFIAMQDDEFVRAAKCIEGGRARTLAIELLQYQPVRAYLRRVQELRLEGYSHRLPAVDLGVGRGLPPERLVEAGLLQRDVRISCRQTGHALFDLPSADALALITLSKAKCSQCAATVADEVVEEVLNPTNLAITLIDHSVWLCDLIAQFVRNLGIPASEIARGPASAYGDGQLIVNVGAESFLFVLRDGDMSPAFAQRAIETALLTEPQHLLIVTNGAVEELARLRLYEYVWRRMREGQELDITILEGLEGAQREIERAFERAARRTLARTLFPLDVCLGTSASNFVLALFKSMAAHGAATALQSATYENEEQHARAAVRP